MKKGQTLSTDAIIAVVLFIFAAIMLFYTSGPIQRSNASAKVQLESQELTSALGSEQNLTAMFIKGTKVDEEKLAIALNLSYTNLKTLFGIDSEFCIYLEDENGNIVPLGGKRGIGSPLVKLSDKSCNESAS